jgi:hypothetical protein
MCDISMFILTSANQFFDKLKVDRVLQSGECADLEISFVFFYSRWLQDFLGEFRIDPTILDISKRG